MNCQDGYPLAPTACDDWCFATQRAGCEEDYPEGCVSDCEQDGREWDLPRCEAEWLRLTDCYREASEVDFVCVEGVSRPRAICAAQRAELAECVWPLSGRCVASCLREVYACDQTERDCEAECQTPTPGCEAQDLALYDCRLASPVDCGESGSQPSSEPDVACPDQMVELLVCAGFFAEDDSSEPAP